MKTEYKTLDESTARDVRELVETRFGKSALSILEQILRNPLRKLNSDAGAVGYRGGRAVCLQAEMLRRLYVGWEPIFGLVGGMTCKTRKGCPLRVLLETIDRAAVPKNGSVMVFGNSCVESTAKLSAEAGGVVGPESCTRYLWRAVRPFDCLCYFLRRKILKLDVPDWKPFSTRGSLGFSLPTNGLAIRCVPQIDPCLFDGMMKRYLMGNRGVVCSRSAEELNWIFGERVKRGEVVVLGAFRAGELMGYLMMDGRKEARRWEIKDWIAVNNDLHVLETLLKAACLFLKRLTPAMMLEVIGFEQRVQPILKRYLPHERGMGHNTFSWNAVDEAWRTRLNGELTSGEGWFYGPYDGDWCMC